MAGPETTIVYGRERSGSCAVECALAEAGVPFEVVEIDLSKDQQGSAEYADLNPARKIPAIQFPDGVFMTESAAILIAIAERWPEARLLPPAGEPERSQALRWLVYIATEIYPLIEIADYPERFTPDPDLVDRMRDLVRERIRARWALVEHAAAGEGAMLLSGFSVVDLYIATLSRWEVGEDWRLANAMRVEGITHAIAARPRVAPVWGRHFG